jgi:hypothetical protein
MRKITLPVALFITIACTARKNRVWSRDGYPETENVWKMDGAGTQVNVGSRGTDT